MGNIILTGDRPTGRLHLGHLVGSLNQRVQMQNAGNYDEMYIEIADAQATTDNAGNIQKVKDNVIEVALDYLSCGIDPAFYANRQRSFDEILPWDHLDYGIDKEFLVSECQKAYENITTQNCREKCAGCGAAKFKGGVCYEKR